MHVKDAVPGREVPLGEGLVNIPNYIDAVRSTGFTGPVLLETGGDFETRYERTQEAKPILDKILANSV